MLLPVCVYIITMFFFSKLLNISILTYNRHLEIMSKLFCFNNIVEMFVKTVSFVSRYLFKIWFSLSMNESEKKKRKLDFKTNSWHFSFSFKT